MLTFIQTKPLIAATLMLLVLSILCQIMIGVLYQRMIKETENMASTENKLLKQCKLKFTNCYQLNMGVTNIPVFVDKFMYKISIAKISLPAFGHLAGQFMLLSVLAAGIGACKGIIDGKTLGELLPYYIISLFGLYVYFSIASIVDINGKKNILKTNLIDYLENNMVNHLKTSNEEKKILEETERNMEKEAKRLQSPVFGKPEERELEELLKEILT